MERFGKYGRKIKLNSENIWKMGRKLGNFVFDMDNMEEMQVE